MMIPDDTNLVFVKDDDGEDKEPPAPVTVYVKNEGKPPALLFLEHRVPDGTNLVFVKDDDGGDEEPPAPVTVYVPYVTREGDDEEPPAPGH